ncbi:MAG: helix-turn-helix domain-containing protein [Chloroflexota bacterium]
MVLHEPGLYKLCQRESSAYAYNFFMGETSAILGVSEVTLRQWTDQGRIKAFISHRRYSKTELNKLINSKRPSG